MSRTSGPRLLLLNGPPGIGKSTLSRRYAEERPGTLELDVDRLRSFVGGWRERFEETGGLVRPLAIEMIRTWLAGGHDVVLPQYLGRTSEVERFSRAATDGGFGFVHVLLLDDVESAVARFGRRAGDDPWHEHVRGIVAAQGGETELRAAHARLLAVREECPDAVVVDSVEGRPEATYAALVEALPDRDPQVGGC